MKLPYWIQRFYNINWGVVVNTEWAFTVLFFEICIVLTQMKEASFY